MNVFFIVCGGIGEKKVTVQPIEKRVDGKQRRLKHFFFLNGYSQSGTLFAHK